MSRYSERITEMLRNADRKTIRDKKKVISDLVEFCGNDDATKEISNNTKRNTPGIAKWPYILHIAHKLLVEETQRTAARDTHSRLNNERQNMANAVLSTVRIANAEENPLLKASDLVPLVLQIFERKMYECYYATYLEILVKYVLPFKAYQISISLEQWKELLKQCIKLYTNPSKLDKRDILKALQMIIEYGCLHSNLLLEVKKILPFLASIFVDVKAKEEILAEPAYKLTNTVCQYIGTENRIALCEFSENILQDIMILNGSSEKYKLFLTIIWIHHPGGVGFNHDSFYARDCSVWKMILCAMYSVIFKNCKAEFLPQSFIEFASEVFKQVFEDPSLFSDVKPFDTYFCSAQVTKRRRISLTVRRPIDLIVNCGPEEAWPLIQILKNCISTYPECIKPDEFIQLLECLTELLAQSRKNENIMDSLYGFLSVLLETGTLLSMDSDVQNTKILWDKIWDTLLRSLSMNQNVVSGHKLVQLLIKKNKMSNPTALLKLYLIKTIRWSPSSLHTLRIFCEHTPLQDDVSICNTNSCSPTTDLDSARIYLARWVLDIPWHTTTARISIDDLCVVLINIATKSYYINELNNENCHDATESFCNWLQEEETPDDFRSMVFKNIEDCYFSLTYEPNLFTSTVKEFTQDSTRKHVYISDIKQVVLFLTKNLCNVVNSEEESNEPASIMKIALTAKFASILKKLNIENPCLIDCLKTSVENIYRKLTNLDFSESRYIYLYNLTKALNVLYETEYHPDIATVILSSCTLDMLRNIYNLLNMEDHAIVDYNEIVKKLEDYNAFQGRRRRSERLNDISDIERTEGIIRIQTVRALALLSCMKTGAEKTDVQRNLVKSLIDFHDFISIVDFKIALLVLELLLSKENKEILRAEHAANLTSNLLELSRHCGKEGIRVHYVLSILPYFYKHIQNSNDEGEYVINILSTVYKSLCKEEQGPMVHVKFLKCLSQIVRENPHLCWSKLETVSVSESILLSLESPIFLVRHEAVRCIYELFSSSNINFKWKSLLFSKLEKSVINLLTVRRNLTEQEKVDEQKTRTASALLALGAVICTSGVLQSKALLTVLKLWVDKQIEIQTIQKILQVIEKQIDYRFLIEDNMSYLLSHWIRFGYPLNAFPWAIANCESEEQFYRKYINILGSIKMRTSGITDVTSLCSNIGLTFENIFESMFPQILSWLLTCVYGDRENNEQFRLANNIFHNLIANKSEFSTVRKFSELLTTNLEETIYDLIKRLHDEEHFERTFEVQVAFPDLDPPHMKQQVLDKCFKSLGKNFFINQKSLQHILATSCSNVLQKILLRLTRDIYKMKFIEHKLKAFHQYTYFCTLLTEEIMCDYCDTISMYFIREVSYTILHLVKDSNNQLSDLACKYLYIFLQAVLPARSTEVKDTLSFCVSTLVPVVQSHKIPVALKVLEYLIVERKDVLSDAIQKLNSFPKTAEFEKIEEIHHTLKHKTEIVYSLEKEIQHFLNAVNDMNATCSVEELSHLRLELSSRKKELEDMYNKLDTLRGFSEDCAESVLHRLVYKLVKFTESSNVRVSIEASKCLGELGPADLTTMILHLDRTYTSESPYVIEILSCKIVNLLTEFLVRSNVELRAASADALYTVLSSPWGQKLTDKNQTKNLQTALENGNITLCTSYIQPFIFKGKSRMSQVIYIDSNNFKRFMDPSNAIWTVKSNGSYSDWIVEITCCLATCFSGFYLESLIPVCKLSTEFCELILPRIIYLVISIDEKLAVEVCHCINNFFDYHFNSANREDQGSFGSQKRVCCPHETVRCMLNIANYVRIQVGDSISLKLSYMYIAKAAQYCSAYFTAVFYTELACEANLTQLRNFNNVSKIDYIYEYDPVQGKELQNMLRDAYLKIGDPDAIYGCGSSHLEDQSSRVQHYIHMRKWDEVMLTQDIELSFGNNSVIRDMMNALHQSGLQYLLSQLTFNSQKYLEFMNDDLLYEHVWRLSDWSTLDARNRNSQRFSNNISQVTENDYYLYHYQALKFFHEGNTGEIQNAVERARISVIKALHNTSLESSKTVYEKLMQLQMLREIEELGLAKPHEYAEILSKWQNYNIASSNDFQYIEPILTQRTVMYQIKDSLRSDSVFKSERVNTYLKIAEAAESRGYLQVAARALGSLAKESNLPVEIRDKLRYQESLLAWKRNDQEVGRYLLRSLINKSSLDPTLRVQALRVYGDWMAEMKSENSQDVINKYYMKSIQASSSIAESEATKNLHKTQVALARFADDQFEQISAYMKSPQFENLKECIEYSCKEVKLDTASKDQDLRRAMIINQKQSTNDMAELENIKKERNNYLILALKYYLKALYQSEDYNLLIFRVIALWLDNMLNEDVNTLLKETLDRIPSYKFVPLLPQLAAHMSNVLDEFSAKVYKILERCALEHPHHTLPVLLALKNLYGDREYTDKKAKNVKEEPRVLGARKLLTSLNKSNVNETLCEMEKLSHALVMLAYLGVEEHAASSTHKIPKNQAILRIKDFRNVLVPTLTIGTSRTYDSIVGVWKYVETFETVGGINVPKKVTCVGTDGISRTQLVKGKDDLRQDAVMQQVFNVMNTLLRACKETKRRKLKIKTYKVVPLTQRSGILEWCDNTVPIVKILIGSDGVSGIHEKYYPNDYTAKLCRKKMADVAKVSNETRLKVFMDCCKHFHPAFHHFFMEKYSTPEAWFERRLAYTRSVATSSIAGYILGLGDRHLSNILIDQTTAEVIHIDFGIAFEQGKVLPFPETVPFRLTRDIEVAMGVSGVEGIMRRSCEEILSVLREQKQIIITLLQVLLYDPLFTWTITPAKAYKLQRGNAVDSSDNQAPIMTNKTAERALLRIEQKLQGTEEGLASSVSGQVERLIQQARDPSNLCRLFYGWQPYL